MKKVFDFIQKYFKYIFIGLILFTAFMAFYTKRNLTLENNISKLLPEETTEVKIMDNIGLLDQLLFDISLTKNRKDPDQLIKIAEHLAQKLEKTGEFISVFFKVNPADFQETIQKLYEKRFFLIRLQDLSVKDFDNNNYIYQQLEKIKFKLLSFESLVSKDYLMKDPLGIAEEGIRNLFKQNISYKAKMKNNVIFSEDEQHVLIITKPKEKSFNIDFTKVLMRNINEIKKEAKDAEVKVLGGHVYALSSATMMQFDMTLISILSTLAILLIDFLSFRIPKVLVISFIPTFFGLLAGTFSVALLFQSVHGVTLIFGSMLIGICIDYSTYYFISYTYERDRFKAVMKIKNSLFFGYLCALAVNVALFFSDFRFFREIAVFFTVGLTSSFLLSFFILPQIKFKNNLQVGILLKGYEKFLRKLTHLVSRNKLIVSGIMGAVFIVSAVIVLRINFDSNIRNLNYTEPELKKIETEFLARYGDISTSNMIISSGKNLQAALKNNDQVFELLTQAKKEGKIESFYNIHPLIPSEKAQEKNQNDLLSQNWNSIRIKVEQNSQKLGFNKNAFNPFFDELEDLKKNPKAYLSLNDIKDSPLFMMINEFVIQRENEVLILSYFRSTVEGQNITGLVSQIKALDPNIFYINQVNLFNNIIQMLQKELLKVIAIAFGFIFIILFFYYRNFKKMIVVSLPALFGIVFSLAFTSAAGFKINIICLFSIVFIVGIGLDYAIFTFDNALNGKKAAHYTPMAVMVAGICTILSFGTLIVSRNTVLSSIGLIIFTGIVSSVFFSISMIPIIVNKWLKKEVEDQEIK